MIDLMVKKKVKRGLLKKIVRKVKKSKPIKKGAVSKVKKGKVKKPAKDIVKKPVKEEKFEIGFEEVVVKCPSCGRSLKVVKSSKFNMEGMLCQRCASGGGVGFVDEDN